MDYMQNYWVGSRTEDKTGSSGREITTCRKLFPEYDFQTKQTHKNLDLRI